MFFIIIKSNFCQPHFQKIRKYRSINELVFSKRKIKKFLFFSTEAGKTSR